MDVCNTCVFQVTHGEGSTRSHLSSADSDPMVQSSLQLPAAATKEFFKVALQLQAKDVKVIRFEAFVLALQLNIGTAAHGLG